MDRKILARPIAGTIGAWIVTLAAVIRLLGGLILPFRRHHWLDLHSSHHHWMHLAVINKFEARIPKFENQVQMAKIQN